jgi:hypothetical protein
LNPYFGYSDDKVEYKVIFRAIKDISLIEEIDINSVESLKSYAMVIKFKDSIFTFQ